jgi:hypothetical protein
MRSVLTAAVVAAEQKADGLSSAFDSLAIPVTVIGGILSAGYTVTMIRAAKPSAEKSRAETQKALLEAEKLRRELGVTSESDEVRRGPSTHADQPGKFLASATVESILVRFVALELFARLWGAVSRPLVEGLDRFTSSPIASLDTVATILFWVFAAPLAFSIFYDVNRHLGIRFVDLSLWRSKQEHVQGARRFMVKLLAAIFLPLMTILVLVLIFGD